MCVIFLFKVTFSIMCLNNKYAISNQWGVGNIEDFIEDIQKLGLYIE